MSFWDSLGGALGLNTTQIDPNAPGASLDTTQADADQLQQQQLAQALLKEAQQGNPAAIAQLQKATDAANASAASLGTTNEMQHGESHMNAARDILNAQAGNRLREGGQERVLNAQGEVAASGELGNLLTGAGSQDVNQAVAGGQAAQGVREANIQLGENAHKNLLGTIGGLGQAASAAAMMLSSGGDVPGKAKFGGDDPANDTIQAKLSPHEIVIPRSIALGADPVGDGARFIAKTILEKHGQAKSHFDAGGLTSSFAPNLLESAPQQAPSVQNGGLLNTGQFDATQGTQGQLRDINLLNSAGPAAGGASVAPQEFQNAQDSAMAQSLLGAARAAPGSAALSAGMGAGSQAIQGAAGRSGETVLGESMNAQNAMARQLLAMRTQQQQLAQAKQKAAFQNTMMNAGLTMDQQNTAKALLGGAGAMAAGVASMPWGNGGNALNGEDINAQLDFGHEGVKNAISNVGGETPVGDSSALDVSAAHGGEIPEEDEEQSTVFLKALKRSRGAKGSGFKRMLAQQAEHSSRLDKLEKMLKRHA